MQKTFPASIDHLYAMLAFIHENSVSRNFSKEVLSQVELACEEALVNIITYAYPEDQGTIVIDCINLSKGIKIIIQDTGVPFDPFTRIKEKEIDDKISIEHRNEGGYGVFLIHELMDEVYYQRQENRNVLTLVKYF